MYTVTIYIHDSQTSYDVLMHMYNIKINL